MILTIESMHVQLVFYLKNLSLNVTLKVLNILTDKNNEGIPRRGNSGLLLQLNCGHHSCICRFYFRERSKCLDFEAKYSISLCFMLCKNRTNKKSLNKCHSPLIIYHPTKTFFSFLYFTGTFWIMFKQYSSYMGTPIERAGVCSNV